MVIIIDNISCLQLLVRGPELGEYKCHILGEARDIATNFSQFFKLKVSFGSI